MKPRKPNETDADYIARLELAYAEKKKTNDRWRKDWKRMMRVILPAADKAGQILQAAAEVTGTRDNPEIKSHIERLRALASCNWHDDDFHPAEVPEFPPANPEKFGGDAEMILHSAIERVKQSRPPWESWRDALPAYKGVNPADLDWEGIANEVFDAFTDLEFSRGLLRLDLRSTMYDHCFERISRALREAERRVRDEHEHELSQFEQEPAF